MARRSRKVGVWLVLILAGPLLVSGLVAFARRVNAAAPEVGVEWTQSSLGAVAIEVDESSPAARVGLRPGDRLITVDGRPIASSLDAGELAW
ncbi:MAG TPA: PDZ domain-containing protein, partial [Candidatus Polarisedimenticolaceae bacterium]|nr:PDZ domain-containing protein [Candidatus Polarisedimenticolaceae bacterium]